ncbi:penicillin acylase family protein [Qipengyuania sp. JC766]|uniref:penicillin acylase family protein n=1 Tax=Qipengyuania sp. JC766 TaxID=3232139 RepID=UPI003457467F
MTRRALLLASAAVLALGAGIGLVAKASPFRTSPAPRPRAPIAITQDIFGIPHIRAESLHDAYFGQGYVVARDRLFQLDLDLRRDMGRMAEAFGPGFLAADRAARLFHYRGDVAAELASIPDDVVDCVQGYCAGINARIAEIAVEPALAPPEYTILGITPLLWTLEDCIRRRGAGSDDADEQIRRAMLEARDLLEYERWREPLRPAWSFTVPDGLDCTQASRDDLGALRDLHRASPFEPVTVAGLSDLLLREGRRTDLAAQGSNAWTVDGTRSATGRPILANDPHLAIGEFSPRHIVHMTAPGLDIIGAGYPGLPGIMQGHTEFFAFGRTNFHIDQTDLFVLDTHPDDPERYWHNGEWTAFEVVEETISVNGGEPDVATLRYAGGRPVIARDPERNRAIALSTVTMLPGANMRFAIVALNLASDWDSLRDAFRLHVSPTNFHYADMDGNTAWQAIGYAPRRPRHDGLFPAPGDGSFDWTGLLDLAEMPGISNPPAGWIASANDMNLPSDYPHAERILSFTWSDPFRHDRIKQVLGAQDRHTIADSIALLHDVRSLPALALKAMLPALPSPEAEKAAVMLAEWDGDLDADSPAALLFEMVLPGLSDLFHRTAIPEQARDLITCVNLDAMLQALENLDPVLGEAPQSARDAMVDAALGAGWAKAIEVAGDDPTQWRWGDLHTVDIAHPLSALTEIDRAFPPIAGGRSGGDGNTVMARGMRAGGGYDVRHGASFLFVADVGDWDRTRFLLLAGQSADPRSPHYRDFYERWLAGDMPELPFSPEAIEAVAAQTFTLPAG